MDDRPMTRRVIVRRIAGGVAVVVVAGVAVLTLWVEREAGYELAVLGGEGEARALVLYHPSRDAGFSDELSLAVAEGAAAAGLSVDRATMTGDTPADLSPYRFVAVVSNTYFWTPDLPTLRYLRRARFVGTPTIGVMAGAGSTGRAARLLRQALEGAGATVLDVRSFWILRPNDESRMEEPNRAVAVDLARELAAEAAERAIETDR